MLSTFLSPQTEGLLERGNSTIFILARPQATCDRVQWGFLSTSVKST